MNLSVRKFYLPEILLIVLSFMFVAGCASPIKKARILADNGAYDEALVIYDRLADKDPEDVDVIIERKKIRLKLLERRLVDARLSRMGGRMPEAAEILKDVYSKYLTWKESQSAPALSTWEEEIDELMKFVSQEVRQALIKHYPLRASYLIHRYKDLLRTHFADVLDTELKKVQIEGSRSCLALVSDHSTSQQAFEYAKFLQSYCKHFNSPADLTIKTPKSYASLFFGNSNRIIEVEKLPEHLAPVFSSEIENQFKESTYFDSASENTLQVHVKGNVSAREATSRFTEVGKIIETRRGPDPRDPKKTVEFEVSRPFPYVVYKTIYTSTFSPTFNVRVDPNRSPIVKMINQTEDFESIWHQTYAPEARVFPILKRKPDFDNWYNSQIKVAVAVFSELLHTQWAASFCVSPQTESKESVPLIEQYFRCIKDRRNLDHEFVKNPFQSQFGITPKEAFEAL